MGKEEKFVLDEILTRMVDMDASDLHLVDGMPPVARVYGDLVKYDMDKLTSDDIEELVMPILEPYQREQLEKELELDFSYNIKGVSRFRGSIMWQRGTLGVNFRGIAMRIPTIEELGLPEKVKALARMPRGLVLVTGPAGSGKSTTLASIIDLINRESSVNIITIENPIEYLHKHKNSIIKQRDVGIDTHSFAKALRHALRHDPDVILVGEMRDQESISIVLTAAETGHLVFSTLHTQTAVQTIHRIMDVFPTGMRNQIRQQMADTLQGVITQQLLSRTNGNGRVAAVELLITNPAVRNLIRDGKEHQLYTAMQTGRSQGMQTMDQTLADLCKQGIITRDVAIERCVDRMELDSILMSYNF